MVTWRRLTVDDDGAEGLTIPYAEIRSGTGGPALTVLAGVHGGEYTSIATARRFITELDPDRVRGSIRIVPIANPPSFYARSAFVVPQDGKNLNRCFPGRGDGTLAERIAHALFAGVIVGSDFLVDLHAGDIPESLEPFTVYDESAVGPAARRLALDYGFGHCVRQPAAARTVAGSTAAAAADAGIPAIIAECGGNGLLDPGAVGRHLAGLTRLAISVGVLAGSVEPVPPVEEHDGWEWLRTPAPGWWQPAVPVGSRVVAGTVLGSISDAATSAPITEVTAARDGTVLFLTASPAVAADGLLMGIALPAPEAA